MTTWTPTDELGWVHHGSQWDLRVGRDGDDLVARRRDLPSLLECLDRAGARYVRPRSESGGRLARVQVERVPRAAGYRLPTGATVELRVLAEPMARAA